MKKLIVLMLLLFSFLSVQAIDTLEVKPTTEKSIEKVVDTNNTVSMIDSVDCVISFDVTWQKTNHVPMFVNGLSSLMDSSFVSKPNIYKYGDTEEDNNTILEFKIFALNRNRIDTKVLGGGSLSSFKRI